MFEQIITNQNRTCKEALVYEAMKGYIARHVTEMPRIMAVKAEEEPFDKVSQFITSIEESNEVPVWERHFETKHRFFTPHEYGIWRGVHDVFGHVATYQKTSGEMGNFTFNGEIESLFLVAKDTQSILVVEGAILETVQRNLQPDVEFYPFTNEVTESMAKDLVRLTAPQFS